LVREAQKATTIIQEGVDEMRHIVANTMLNLCHGGLQEVGEAERLEVALTEDEIAYHENVGDVGPSMSISCLSTSDLGPSTSRDDIGHFHTYMDIIDSSLRWTSWGDTPHLFTSAPDPYTRYNYMLLYVMRIMNRCIICLIFFCKLLMAEKITSEKITNTIHGTRVTFSIYMEYFPRMCYLKKIKIKLC
jgi:hypothetical protein